MHCLLSSPITRHNICPNAISGLVEFLKQNIVPVAIEIGAGYLFIKEVVNIMSNKHVLLSHPL